MKKVTVTNLKLPLIQRLNKKIPVTKTEVLEQKFPVSHISLDK